MPWSEQTIRYLTQDELERFFSVIKDKRDKAIFALIYHYGLRVSEAALITLEDVDLDGVVTRHGPVSARVLPLLRRPLHRPVVSW